MQHSNIYHELKEKYENREMEQLWKGLWSLLKLTFILEVLVLSWNTQLFLPMVSIVVLLAIWHWNRIN